MVNKKQNSDAPLFRAYCRGFSLVYTLMIVIGVFVAVGSFLTYKLLETQPSSKEIVQKTAVPGVEAVYRVLASEFKRANLILAVDEKWSRRTKIKKSRIEKEIHLFNKRGRIFFAIRIKSRKLQIVRFKSPARYMIPELYENMLIKNMKIYVTKASRFELLPGRGSVRLHLVLDEQSSDKHRGPPSAGMLFKAGKR